MRDEWMSRAMRDFDWAWDCAGETTHREDHNATISGCYRNPRSPGDPDQPVTWRDLLRAATFGSISLCGPAMIGRGGA